MDSQFDSKLASALLGFNWEAVIYCQGISNSLVHEYEDYTRMLQNRARGIEVSAPRSPFGLFEPSRHLIRSTLERMSEEVLLAEMKFGKRPGRIATAGHGLILNAHVLSEGSFTPELMGRSLRNSSELCMNSMGVCRAPVALDWLSEHWLGRDV